MSVDASRYYTEQAAKKKFVQEQAGIEARKQTGDLPKDLATANQRIEDTTTDMRERQDMQDQKFYNAQGRMLGAEEDFRTLATVPRDYKDILHGEAIVEDGVRTQVKKEQAETAAEQAAKEAAANMVADKEAQEREDGKAINRILRRLGLRQ